MFISDVMRALVGDFASSHKGLVVALVVTNLLVPLQDIIVPELTGRMISAIEAAGSLAAPGAALVTGIVLFQVAVLANDVVVTTRVIPELYHHIRAHLTRCMLQTHAHGLNDTVNTGLEITRMLRIPSNISEAAILVLSMVPNLLVYVFATLYLASIDAVLGLIMGGVTTVTFLVIAINFRACVVRSIGVDAALMRSQSRINDVLHNLPAIYSASRQHDELARMSALDTQYQLAYKQLAWINVGIKSAMMPITVVAVALILWRCTALLLRRGGGAFDAGRFVSVFLVFLYVLSSSMRVYELSDQLAWAWGAARVAGMELADAGCFGAEEPEPPQKPQTCRTSASATVSATDVSLTVGVGVEPLLRHVSLQVREGERIAIVGRMGSGKSMLLKLLVGQIRPTRGHLAIGACRYDSLPDAVIRRHIGYMPQSCTLFDTSVLENIRYGVSPTPSVQDVWDAAERIGLTRVLSDVSTLPDGLDTLVGEQGSRISGGQRQAVWLVRLALRRPSVLVVDEPSAAMDSESTARLSDAIVRGFDTVVFVSHDTAFVRRIATRVVTLEAGAVISDVTLKIPSGGARP